MTLLGDLPRQPQSRSRLHQPPRRLHPQARSPPPLLPRFPFTTAVPPLVPRPRGGRPSLQDHRLHSDPFRAQGPRIEAERLAEQAHRPQLRPRRLRLVAFLGLRPLIALDLALAGRDHFAQRRAGRGHRLRCARTYPRPSSLQRAGARSVTIYAKDHPSKRLVPSAPPAHGPPTPASPSPPPRTAAFRSAVGAA